MRFSKLYIVVYICLIGCVSACGRHNGDARHSRISSNDSAKLESFLVRSNSHYQVSEGIAFAQMIRDYAHSESSVDDEIRSLHVLFDLHFTHGHNDMALNVAQRAINLNDYCTNDFLRARSLHFMGRYLVRQRNATLASRNLSTAFSMFRELGDTANVAACFRDMVRSYSQSSIFDSARVTIARCFLLDSLIHNRDGYALDFAVMGEMYLSIFNSDLISPRIDLLDSARLMYDRASAENQNLAARNLNVEEVSYIGYAELYYLLTKYKQLNPEQKAQFLDSALHYQQLSTKYVRIIADGLIRKKFDILGLLTRLEINNYAACRQYADSLIALADAPDAGYLDKEIACRAKSIMSERSGNYTAALKYRELADLYKDAYDSHNSSLAVTVMIAKGQHEGEAARNKALQMQMEGEVKALTMRMISMSVILILLIVLGFFIFRNLRRQEHFNAKIQEINDELQTANEQVSSRNAEITESISYACIIQKAAMPSADEIFNIFGENLVLMKPRDIVSGDFFWASETGPYKLIVAGDCTGHGVPGALLSMLGMSILDYVTNHFGMNHISAGLVLDRMRSYFKRTLNQGSFRTDKALDSIDLALVVVDVHQKQLYYAAAFRPLVYFRHGELVKVKADPMPIGVYPKERDHFTNHVIDLEEGDVFYLFSDGIPDQSGYESADSPMAKAFSNKRLLSLLQEIHKLPFGEQKQRIENALIDWRSPKSESQTMCDQTDDNVIVGISVDNFMTFGK